MADNAQTENTDKISDIVDKAYEKGVELEQPSANPTNPGGGQAMASMDPQSEPAISGSEVSEIADKTLDTSPNSDDVRSDAVKQALEQFASLSVDDKLGVFYYIYEAMGESVTPAAPGAADLELATGFFREFDAMPQGAQQLEAQRAIVQGDDSPISVEYGKLSDKNKLAVWYVIAQRMGKDVIGIPDDYKLSDISQQNLTTLKQLEFEQQITFLEDIAARMGKETIERVV